jgi:hypothetical protein
MKKWKIESIVVKEINVALSRKGNMAGKALLYIPSSANPVLALCSVPVFAKQPRYCGQYPSFVEWGPVLLLAF